MKAFLQKIFSPILNLFEKGEGEFNYRPSHRRVLIIMGPIFFVVSGVSLYFAFKIDQMAALFPTILFGLVGLFCLVVGLLGSDRAVANMWRTAH